jgi:hypothetical protein
VTEPLDTDEPWGVDEDSPMDEGSEQTAVPEGRRGERRADEEAGSDEPAPDDETPPLGAVEPTPTPSAGPGGAPDPAPARRPTPEPTPTGDLPDNPWERDTGVRPEGVSFDDLTGGDEMSERPDDRPAEVDPDVLRDGGPIESQGAATTTGGTAGPASVRRPARRGAAPTTTGDATSGGMEPATGGATSDSSTWPESGAEPGEDRRR